MADEKYCYECFWRSVIKLKSGRHMTICTNDENGNHPEEVGFLSSACDGFESDTPDDDFDFPTDLMFGDIDEIIDACGERSEGE